MGDAMATDQLSRGGSRLLANKLGRRSGRAWIYESADWGAWVCGARGSKRRS
uniref:Uncharacterized protein n=1 Tax=Arundo donax TaxID=35708 RepID=A0A0A9UX98_ARUDO